MSDQFVRLVLVALAITGTLRAAQNLPVFLADNHAETFGWITRNFDLDSPHQLVLVDAHSDASSAERSEELREGLRRVPSEQARAQNVQKWRDSGRIQAFNWIEPLMPRPLDHVCWLAAPQLTEKNRSELQLEAISHLDGRLEIEPRSAASFSRRWQTMDLAGFSSMKVSARPVILAIDLDFFAGMEAEKQQKTIDTIWQTAMDWPGLAGVAFSVSRPWLNDDAEADALISLACGAVARTRGAFLEIDASQDDRPDDSKRQSESTIPLPRWDATQVSEPLRAQWLMMRKNLKITDRKRDWEAILDSWEIGQSAAIIHPECGEIDVDDVWRFPCQAAPALRLMPPAGATGRVRWYALELARSAYDLLPETGLGKSFSKSPGRWIYETKRDLGMTEDFALTAEIWRPDTPGRVRVMAEVETDRGWLPTAPMELRLASGQGFRGALSECFRMPYVFGIAGVEEQNLSGVETGWGSDCSNLLIHAWRRNGQPITWGDPGRLRAQLATKAENVTLAEAPQVSAAEIEAGLVIDFGQHVAAVWEDREPLGKLGGNDLVAHHLGGFPEVLELHQLAKTRPVFSLRVPKSPVAECLVQFAGDVVLAEDEPHVIPGFEKREADLFIANLEGVPSSKTPESESRYDFRFPKQRLTWLRERGLDAVSLANNHAGDAGRAGLVDGLQALAASGIGSFGAGKNAHEACQPWRTQCRGIAIAVFGVCLVESITATSKLPGVAGLPEHANLLEAEIRKSKAAGESVIVMGHWGDEYRTEVNDDQRAWARWLVSRGADLVVGAHPHMIQRTENHGGAVIVHSLGNAVYPKSLKGVDSGEVLSIKRFLMPKGKIGNSPG